MDKSEANKFETSTMAHKKKRKSEAKLGTSTKSTKVKDASTSKRKTKQAVDRLGASPTLSAKEIVDNAEKIEVVRADEVIVEPRIMRVRAK